jgi:hypothetical protein
MRAAAAAEQLHAGAVVAEATETAKALYLMGMREFTCSRTREELRVTCAKDVAGRSSSSDGSSITATVAVDGREWLQRAP